MNIQYLENVYVREITRAHEKGYDIYISGGGQGAKKLYEKCCKSDGRNIPIKAFVLNDNYYDSVDMKRMCDVPVIPMREYPMENPETLLGIGYMHYDFYEEELIKPNEMKGLFLSEDLTFIVDKSGKNNFLDFPFYKANEDKFDLIYDTLSDEKSKRVLEAFIKQLHKKNMMEFVTCGNRMTKIVNAYKKSVSIRI